MIEASAWQVVCIASNDVRQLRRFLSPIISIDLLHLYLQPLGFDCFSDGITIIALIWLWTDMVR